MLGSEDHQSPSLASLKMSQPENLGWMPHSLHCRQILLHQTGNYTDISPVWSRTRDKSGLDHVLGRYLQVMQGLTGSSQIDLNAEIAPRSNGTAPANGDYSGTQHLQSHRLILCSCESMHVLPKSNHARPSRHPRHPTCSTGPAAPQIVQTTHDITCAYQPKKQLLIVEAREQNTASRLQME